MKSHQEVKFQKFRIRMVGVLALLGICNFGFGASDAFAGWTDGRYNSAIDFNGTSTYVDGFGALGNIKSVSFWIKADSLTEDVIDLNGTQTITISSGTISANSFTSPTIYVDGKVISTLADTGWHHIAVTTDTNISASATVVGKVGANYFDGLIDDVRFYQYARTVDEVKTDYNDGLAARFGSQASEAQGLVGYWNFEEGSGQTISDRSSNSNDGTLGANSSVGKDDPVFSVGHDANGPGGMGMSFDGVDDYVDVNTSTYTDISLSAWIYAKDSTQNPIVDAGSGILRFVWFYNTAFQVHDGSWRYVTGLTQNTWYNVALTFIGSTKELTLYVDGVQRYNGIGSSFSNGCLRSIGKYDTSYFFNGLIDEVRIYNRALSADEIRMLYNQKKPIFHAKLDEGSGTTAYDESFNNNDMTLISTPSWTTGKFGSALDFESGSSQYGYVADSSIISIIGDLTISTWIKPESITASTLFDIAGKWDGANESYLLSQYGDEIRVYIDASANYKTTDSANLLANNWYHLETVYDASAQNVDIYLNGILQQGTVTGTIPASIGNDAGRLHIGAEDSSTTAANFYDGIIDDVRIYNYARTAEGVLADYNNGLAARLR